MRKQLSRANMKNPFLHNSYASFEEHFAKLALYTSLDAQVFFDAGRRIRGAQLPVAFVLKPGYVFLRKYLFQGACLDGWKGLLISWMTALNVLTTHMKLWELTKKEGAAP